jgi:hypothetical protein
VEHALTWNPLFNLKEASPFYAHPPFLQPVKQIFMWGVESVRQPFPALPTSRYLRHVFAAPLLGLRLESLTSSKENRLAVLPVTKSVQ